MLEIEFLDSIMFAAQCLRPSVKPDYKPEIKNRPSQVPEMGDERNSKKLGLVQALLVTHHINPITPTAISKKNDRLASK